MKWVELGEVARIETGTTPSTKNPEYHGGKIPFVKPGDLDYQPKVIFEAETYVTDLGAQQARLIPKNGVMVCCIGSLGKLAIAGKDMITNQQINSVIFNEDVIDPKFGAYFLSTQKKELEHLASSTTVAIVNKTNFSRIKIPLPSLSEQKAIVAKLDRAQRLIDIDRQMLVKYDELIQSVFLEMFGDPVRNEKGWERRAIKELGKVVTGNTPPRKNPNNYGSEIEWIKTSNIVENELYPTKAEEYLSKKGKEIGRIIPRNSIIVCCIAGSLSSIGKCSIVDRELAINQQINAIIPDFKILTTNFLFTQLVVGKKMIQEASTKSMKGMISKSNFEKIELIVPDIESQKNFDEIFNEIISELINNRLIEKKSQDLFSSLLQEAFG